MTMAATMFAGCGSTAADSQTADAQGSAGTATEAAKTEKRQRKCCGRRNHIDCVGTIYRIRRRCAA